MLISLLLATVVPEILRILVPFLLHVALGIGVKLLRIEVVLVILVNGATLALVAWLLLLRARPHVIAGIIVT